MKYLKQYESYNLILESSDYDTSIGYMSSQDHVIPFKTWSAMKEVFFLNFYKWVKSSKKDWDILATGHFEDLIDKENKKWSGYNKLIRSFSSIFRDKDTLKFYISPFEITENCISPHFWARQDPLKEFNLDDPDDWKRQFVLGFSLDKIKEPDFTDINATSEDLTLYKNAWYLTSYANHFKKFSVTVKKEPLEAKPILQFIVNEFVPNDRQDYASVLSKMEEFFIKQFDIFLDIVVTDKENIASAVKFLQDAYDYNAKFILKAFGMIQLKETHLVWLRQHTPKIFEDIKSTRNVDDRWKTDLSADMGELGF